MFYTLIKHVWVFDQSQHAQGPTYNNYYYKIIERESH